MRSQSNRQAFIFAFVAALICGSLAYCGRGTAPDAGRLPYRDAKQSTERRVDDLLARMTPEEKFGQLFMVSGDLAGGEDAYKTGSSGSSSGRQGPGRAAEHINAIQRFSPRGRDWESRSFLSMKPSTGWSRKGRRPSPKRSAWPRLGSRTCGRVAPAIALETARSGHPSGPVARLEHRPGRPLGPDRGDLRRGSVPGRRDGAAYISEMEQRGVIATPKHFAANVGDGGRDSYPIHLNERRLDEVEFPAFRSAFRKAGRVR